MEYALRVILNLLPSRAVYAHCDVPCGIYDPHEAQVAAHTVIRMTKLIMDAHEEKDEKILMHNIARFTKVKEDHSEKVKHEVRVIWGDYFKPEMLKEYPNVHELVFTIMKTASKARQGVDMDAANELLVKVQEFAEIFWKSKGRSTIRVKSGYPTDLDMVLPS